LYINKKYRRQAGRGLTRIFPALDISQFPRDQRSRDLPDRDFPCTGHLTIPWGPEEQGLIKQGFAQIRMRDGKEGERDSEVDRGTEKGGRNIK